MYGYSLGLNIARQGTQLNLPDWGLLPFFALPENGITLVEGVTQTIYGDALINVPIVNNLTVSYTCAIGTQSGKNLLLTTPAAGTYPCTITFRNKGLLIGTYIINISVIAKAAAGTKSILMVGDSVMHNGMVYNRYQPQITGLLSNSSITFLGTQDAPNNHEGHDGFTWKIFATGIGATSPFIKAEVLDIAAYFTDNSIATPDVVVFQLGVNECIQNCLVNTLPFTDAEITTTVNYAKTLIDAFLAYDSNLKILIELPTITSSTSVAWNIDYDETNYLQDQFIENVNKYSVAATSAFANGIYNSRVDCGYSRIYLDRATGYSEATNNGVHPNTAGRDMTGAGIALDLNKIISIDLANAFTTTWDTELAGSATKTIVIPTSAGGYDCVIDWGDGTLERSTGTPGNITHEYAETGVKTVRINGLFPRINFNATGDKLKILTIEKWGNIAWSTFNNAFSGCANLEGNYTDTPNTANTISATAMFYGCAKFNSPVNFVTTNMTTMDNMFGGCTIFNQSVSSFNTANVTVMTSMFFGCLVFNQSVSNFNTAKVTGMSYMFYNCRKFNQSLSNFNTALVDTMRAMFFNCFEFNQSLANFNTAKVTTMKEMLQSTYVFNQSLAGFDVSLVTTMENMLLAANEFSTANYDATLIAWAVLTLQPNVLFHAGDAKYSAGAAATARGVLTGAPNTWTITDGGQV